mgnify:CR=1 FL=1
MSCPFKVVFFYIVVNFTADCFGFVVHFNVNLVRTLNGFPQVLQFFFLLEFSFCGVVIPFTQDCVNLVFQWSNLCIVPPAFFLPSIVAFIEPHPQLRVSVLSLLLGEVNA